MQEFPYWSSLRHWSPIGRGPPRALLKMAGLIKAPYKEDVLVNQVSPTARERAAAIIGGPDFSGKLPFSRIVHNSRRRPPSSLVQNNTPESSRRTPRNHQNTPPDRRAPYQRGPRDRPTRRPPHPVNKHRVAAGGCLLTGGGGSSRNFPTGVLFATGLL